MKSDWFSGLTLDVPTLVLVYLQKVTVLKVLCMKAHCHDAKSICLAKDSLLYIFFH
jgi:hypothetical protein